MTALHGDVGEALSADPDSTEPTEPTASLPWWSTIARSRTWTDAVLPTILLRIVLLAFGVLALIIFRGDARTGSWLDIWNR